MKKLCKEKFENILIYDISYKILTSTKPLRISFDEIDGFIKIHNGIRYIVLFGCGWFDKICDRIKNLISQKNLTTDSINHDFVRIRIDSYNSLPIKKFLTFYYVIILIKSVVNKSRNNC